jgi:hypothetical protein
VLYPEYLNVLGAALYLYSATLYPSENEADYAHDVVTYDVHVIETCASAVELVATVGWTWSWWVTFPRVPGRGATLVRSIRQSWLTGEKAGWLVPRRLQFLSPGVYVIIKCMWCVPVLCWRLQDDPDVWSLMTLYVGAFIYFLYNIQVSRRSKPIRLWKKVSILDDLAL